MHETPRRSLKDNYDVVELYSLASEDEKRRTHELVRPIKKERRLLTLFEEVRMTGVILAGGLNRRYPILKGLIEVKGKRLIERVRDSLSILERVIIITNRPDAYFYLGIPMYGDLIDFRCPLTGIYTALISSGDDIIVSACDMPFINPEVVRLIKDEAAEKFEDYDAVIPLFNERPQPLLGAYSKSLIPEIEKWLIEKRCKMVEFLKGVKTLYLDETLIKRIDPQGLSFININTPEEKLKIDEILNIEGYMPLTVPK